MLHTKNRPTVDRCFVLFRRCVSTSSVTAYTGEQRESQTVGNRVDCFDSRLLRYDGRPNETRGIYDRCVT
jgi:hypothetical protein